MDLFGIFNRSDAKDRYPSRYKPKVPDWRDAPKITGDLNHTVKYLRQTAGRSIDFRISSSDINGREVAVAFFATITDKQVIEELLERIKSHDFPKHLSMKVLPSYLARHVLTSTNITIMENLWEIRERLTLGEAILLVDGLNRAVSVGAGSVEQRRPNLPLLESSSRGAQVAFVEDLNINLGLLRHVLQSDALTIREIVVGYRSRTRVALIYEHDVVNMTLLETVTKRIEAVHVDKLTGSATLEQRIVDNRWTIFPLTRANSRLDNATKEIGQGKILILVDGDPTGLIVPGNIFDNFQTMEDDQHNYIEATLIRWLRIVSFLLAIYLPGAYISLTDFNPELMPHILVMQIAGSRETVPLNASLEVITMQFSIEIIREAALRMPKVMGQTIGIVGGLVLGQAAVEAGLVSNILIVVIALTAIATFVIPNYEFTTVTRILSWANIIGASLFGVYGLLLMSMLMMYHMYSLKSFGSKYMVPINGEHWKDFFLDGIFRFPLAMLDKRAEHLNNKESTRSSDYTDPAPHPLLEKNPHVLKKSEDRRI
ncbi:spore germination protein [Alicyclobacillus tolerans]|uniref:Spore germination protein KA/spore germination protein n=1 Tax=Alicyclobacillus tolerans TaxID=90970 RepID=A0A1M6W896_9BACL|nr:spore germination protein [Alicyclobacillus montanus]SHK89973.1 spore germination protein KA/spore germination protein [Alicyclobacillus montanus]